MLVFWANGGSSPVNGTRRALHDAARPDERTVYGMLAEPEALNPRR